MLQIKANSIEDNIYPKPRSEDINEKDSIIMR